MEKKEAEPPDVSKPAKIKSEKPTELPDPDVTTDAAPPTEATSEAPMETTLTPTAVENYPAEDNPEEAKEEAVNEPMETFTEPVVEDTPATDTPPAPVATEANTILEPGEQKPALKDVVTTHVVVPEQNRKTTKNNQAAQVQTTYSKVGAPLTDDDDAVTEGASPFNQNPARPETDPPDVASSRHRFVEPTDKLPMTTMAWDKILIFADMASNKMIQCVQPFRMRKSDEDTIGPMTQFHNTAEDGVAYKFLLFDHDSQPPGQLNMHRPTAEMSMLHITRISITDDPADMMPSYHNSVGSVTESDDPLLNISTRGPYRRRSICQQKT